MVSTAAATRTILEVQDLKTYFFTRRGVMKAVDGVSFSLGEQEVLGLVGESGCGKTITCLSIMRLVPQPAGRIVGGKILFDGVDLTQLRGGDMQKLRGCRVSMILQDPMMSLNPCFTIGAQVGEAIQIHQKLKRKAVWDRAAEVLGWVQIPAPRQRLHDYPHQMSGGMRQRVVGAMAISCQPGLLIADEPTTSLDVTTQAQYLRLLKSLQKDLRLSLIFITHDLGIVAKMCDRVAVMYAGKIVESAGVGELFESPRHPYTAALMACVPRLHDDVKRLASIEGQPPPLNDLPAGCSFAPRCSQAKDICRREYPAQVAVQPDHVVSCWAVA